MNNLNKANQARKEKAINKLFQFDDYGTTSFKRLIDKGNVFVKAEKVQVPSVKWNRAKYNRMSYDEQKEYDKKREKKKDEYYLYYSNKIFTDVSKYVYEYYLEQQ